jgi:hypothetical protein
MAGSNLPPTPDAEYRLRLTTWAAMLFSFITYFILAKALHPTSAGANPLLVRALMFVAVTIVAASFPLKNFFYNRARQSNSASLLRTGELIAFTLCEMAALFGLVVWFVAAAPQYYWFLILGAAGQLLHWPKREVE